MNYGESCEFWTTVSRQVNKKWCYVGYDTTCPDRYLSNAGDIHQTHKDDLRAPQLTEGRKARVTGIVKQFKSEIAVDNRGKGKYCGNFNAQDLETAIDMCREVGWPSLIVTILDLVIRVPMILIIWKFLSNRCMDELPSEENYDIVWSDDEDNFFGDTYGISTSKSYEESDMYSSAPSDDNNQGGGWTERLFGKKTD